MIENLHNNKRYVGFHATNKEYNEDNYFGSGRLLKKAIKKYGIQYFVKGKIEDVNVEEWKEKETYWIRKMNAHVSLGGYNLTWGGEGTLGYKHSEESKEKDRQSHKGKKASKETRKKLSISHKGVKIHSEEFKRNLGKNNTLYKTGKTHSEETRKKMSKSQKGKKQSEEHIRNRSLALKGRPGGMKGKHHTEESKEKNRQAILGKKHTKEHNENFGKSMKGKIPWNKGLTKETDNRVKIIGDKRRKSKI